MNRSLTCWRVLRTLVMTGAILSVVPHRLVAQQAPARRSSVPWTLVDAIGYGGLGFGLGAAAAFAQDDGSIGSGVAMIGMATAFGLGIGIKVGHDASVALKKGQPVGSATRFGALTGAVLAGATAGALVAVPLVNGGSESGTAIGSDETTVAVTTATGALLGFVLASSQRKYFERAQQVSITPFSTRHRGHGLRVALRF